MNVPGRLHNLSQEIDGEKEEWHAYSSHFVTLASNAVERRSLSASQSVTPSPQKQRKVTKPALYSWTLRLCQTISPASSSKSKGEGEDSETEDEDEDDTPSVQTIAWYGAQFNLSKSQALVKDSGESSWDMLELRVKVAWDSGAIDVMAVESNRARDGTYSSVKLSFDSTDVEKEGEDEAAVPKAKVEVLLHRLTTSEELQAATTIASDLAKAFNTLKGQTQTLKQERDGHRKLLQNNRRHERHKEGTSSIVNPGRMKRKVEDDEGFEGDEEQEAA